jgi:arginase
VAATAGEAAGTTDGARARARLTSPYAAFADPVRSVPMRGIELIGVPSAAGTHGPGQEDAPAWLRDAGLLTGLAARGVAVRDHGDLPRVPFRPDPDHPRQQNLGLVTEVARNVAGRVAALCGGGDGAGLPLVLGGDCTITIGVLAGLLERHPEAGLMYFDGDIDVSTPQTTTSGILDTMGLAHLLGSGTPELARIGPRYPLMPGERIVAFGYDFAEAPEPARAWLTEQKVTQYPATGMDDPPARAAEAMSALAGRSRPVLVHFDVDVINSTEFPLADFPHFNQGLSYPDALACLRVFGRHEAFGGLVITEVNPHRDPDGRLTARLAADVAEILGR